MGPWVTTVSSSQQRKGRLIATPTMKSFASKSQKAKAKSQKIIPSEYHQNTIEDFSFPLNSPSAAVKTPSDAICLHLRDSFYDDNPPNHLDTIHIYRQLMTSTRMASSFTPCDHDLQHHDGGSLLPLPLPHPVHRQSISGVYSVDPRRHSGATRRRLPASLRRHPASFPGHLYLPA